MSSYSLLAVETAKRRAPKAILAPFTLPKMEKNLQFLAFARGQFCYFFKSNVFLVLPYGPRLKTLCRGPLRLPKQSPVRKGGQRSVRTAHRFSRATRKCLAHILIKKIRWELPNDFSSKMVFDFCSNHKQKYRSSDIDRPTCLRKFFEPQKISYASYLYAKNKKHDIIYNGSTIPPKSGGDGCVYWFLERNPC